MHELDTQFATRQVLRTDIIRKYCLAGLSGEDDYRKFAWAYAFTVAEHLELLEILNVDWVALYAAVCELALQSGLQFDALGAPGARLM